MSGFRLNPMLIEALVLRSQSENEFVIEHRSQTTHMTDVVKDAIIALIEVVLEGVPGRNFQYEITTEDWGTVKFNCSPKDAYDQSDWDNCISYMQGILDELTKARAFVPQENKRA